MQIEDKCSEKKGNREVNTIFKDLNSIVRSSRATVDHGGIGPIIMELSKTMIGDETKIKLIFVPKKASAVVINLTKLQNLIFSSTIVKLEGRKTYLPVFKRSEISFTKLNVSLDTIFHLSFVDLG